VVVKEPYASAKRVFWMVDSGHSVSLKASSDAQRSHSEPSAGLKSVGSLANRWLMWIGSAGWGS
jgi:hypothetical protein